MREPLVFLPGMMCDARVFSPQMIAFSSEHHVICAPMLDEEGIEDFILNLLPGLPRKFALVGHGLGGVAAMEVLNRAPSRVTRIALMNTSSLPETPETAADYEPMIVKLMAGRLEEAVSALIPPDSLAPGPQRTAITLLLEDMAAQVGEGAIIRQVRATQRRRDYQAVLRRCRVPALVLCGAHDGLTSPKHHSFMSELIPFGRLAVVEDAGHLPTLEQPEAVISDLRAWMKQPLVLQTRADV